MPELNDLEGDRTRWLALSGPLAGMELLIHYASPAEGEKFRRRLQHLGVMKPGKDGGQVLADGREGAYLEEFCKFYVRDWKGATRGGEPAAYDAAALAKVMGAVGSALKEVTEAVAAEEGFFVSGANGQP